jgi:antitoxin (DNA-binding transcriptional repressor) of toxin-antitoxin stability system
MSGMSDKAEENVRWVAAREFARNVAEILDDVQFKRRTVIVTRYGRRAAMLVPLDDMSRVPKATPVEEVEPPEIDDPLQRRIYEAVAKREQLRPKMFQIDAALFSRTLGRMEIAGLIIKTWSGYRVRPKPLVESP